MTSTCMIQMLSRPEPQEVKQTMYSGCKASCQNWTWPVPPLDKLGPVGICQPASRGEVTIVEGCSSQFPWLPHLITRGRGTSHYITVSQKGKQRKSELLLYLPSCSYSSCVKEIPSPILFRVLILKVNNFIKCVVGSCIPCQFFFFNKVGTLCLLIFWRLFSSERTQH